MMTAFSSQGHQPGGPMQACRKDTSVSPGEIIVVVFEKCAIIATAVLRSQHCRGASNLRLRVVGKEESCEGTDRSYVCVSFSTRKWDRWRAPLSVLQVSFADGIPLPCHNSGPNQLSESRFRVRCGPFHNPTRPRDRLAYRTCYTQVLLAGGNWTSVEPESLSSSPHISSHQPEFRGDDCFNVSATRNSPGGVSTRADSEAAVGRRLPGPVG
jgi:hypothetical protein